MLALLRSSLRSQRRAVALVAAIALSQALGVHNTFACALGHDATVEQSQMAMSHDMGTDMEPTQAPDGMPSKDGCDATPHHSCPSSPTDGGCALMSACATPTALAESPVPVLSVAPRALVPVTLQHELQRATAPEPPPPRA